MGVFQRETGALYKYNHRFIYTHTCFRIEKHSGTHISHFIVIYIHITIHQMCIRQSVSGFFSQKLRHTAIHTERLVFYIKDDYLTCI